MKTPFEERKEAMAQIVRSLLAKPEVQCSLNNGRSENDIREYVKLNVNFLFDAVYDSVK